ncbi:MAG: PEP-CTERM sorting domain-containing protein [Trichocoleus desertorum ATA4-8-CV12]|jgi:hypothetical protein|nr:PEP-CTERM sorting domain-containing protein [Trichocoleus desertorum ATA4-8-CV12]
MKQLAKSALAAFSLTCLSTSLFQALPAQAASLNFNLSFIEDNSGRTGSGTLQIDDSKALGSGFFEITDFQVLTPQSKSLTLSNYVPASPSFVLGFNQTLGSIAQVSSDAIFSPFIVEAPGSFLFFERFEKRYIEDLFFPSETRGSFTAELVPAENPPVEVPEPGVLLGTLAVMGMAYKLKGRFLRSC